MTPPVSRTGRLLDLASIACVVGGGAGFARAYYVMGILESGGTVDNPAYPGGIAQFNHYAAVSNAGLAVVAAGVAIAAAAALLARRQSRATA